MYRINLLFRWNMPFSRTCNPVFENSPLFIYYFRFISESLSDPEENVAEGEIAICMGIHPKSRWIKKDF